MTVRNRIRAILSERIMISDGGIGTLLQGRGLKPGHPPEVMLLEAFHEVESVHRLYVEAGADMITTNSFGASRPKLAQHGLAAHFEEINRKAVEAACRASDGKALIAASIGPTGELLQPMGSMTMESLLEEFRAQVRLLKSAGADFAILETMGDLGELQAAARACFMERLPFMASMTFNTAGRSLSGSAPESVAVSLEAYDPIAIGTNCGLGPDEMIPRIREFALATDYPILAQPNAGLPQLVGTETVFRLSPEPFAAQAVALAEAGAAIIGGCCGTTPAHIEALRKALEGRKPWERKRQFGVRFAARSGIAVAGSDHPFCVIGERINPTGRKSLSRQLREMDFTLLRKDAALQVERGAVLLDVNVSVPDSSEPDLMSRAIHEIQSLLPAVPLSIDSNDPATLAQGLRQVVGVPLLNSISGEISRLEKLLPIVAETGANFIALAMDESGIPADAEARLAIIDRIIKAAESHGISRNRILVDCLVFTVASQPHQARETLRAIRRIRDESGCATSLGVSNVSFGLPARDALSSTFLAMAMSAGLSAGIINPLSDRMMETVRASELLANRDPAARAYVAFTAEREKRDQERIGEVALRSKPKVPDNADATVGPATGLIESIDIQRMIREGDRKGAVAALEALLRGGRTPSDLLSKELIPAIRDVGLRYASGEIYLPQLILAGETMRAGVDFLRPELAESAESGLHGTPLVIGTVEGDIHDIGKNIVTIVLENQGFRVVDLGKNVDTEHFVAAVLEHRAPVAALSALMTTTMPAMETTVKMLHERCPDVKVMVGGAVVTQAFADRIGADGFAREAVGAGNLARKLAGLPVL